MQGSRINYRRSVAEESAGIHLRSAAHLRPGQTPPAQQESVDVSFLFQPSCMPEVGKEGGCGQEIPRGIVGLERVEVSHLPTGLSTGQILVAS